MDDWIGFFKEAPHIAALIILVIVFLRFMGAMGKGIAKSNDNFLEEIAAARLSREVVAKECHEVQKSSIAATAENTVVLGDLKVEVREFRNLRINGVK